MKLEIGTKHKHYTGLEFPHLTWEEVISHIDKNVIVSNKIEELPNYGLTTYNAYEMEKTKPIMDLVKQIDPTRLASAFMFLSFTSKSETFGKHKDQQDVWFWQTIGKTRWTVFDEEIKVYELSPGEMLYIPKGMYHHTQPLTPRVGISYGLESTDQISDEDWLAEAKAGI